MQSSSLLEAKRFGVGDKIMRDLAGEGHLQGASTMNFSPTQFNRNCLFTQVTIHRQLQVLYFALCVGTAGQGECEPIALIFQLIY